jgi:hypothetical protein
MASLSEGMKKRLRIEKFYSVGIEMLIVCRTPYQSMDYHSCIRGFEEEVNVFAHIE